MSENTAKSRVFSASSEAAEGTQHLFRMGTT